MKKTNIFIALSVFLNIPFLAATDETGLRNRKHIKKEIVPLDIKPTIYLLPDDVILLIINDYLNYGDKCGMDKVCKRFHKLIENGKLIALPKTHPFYTRLLSLPTPQLVNFFKDNNNLSGIDWSELKTVYLKNPPRAVNTEPRDCYQYNDDEEQRIKFAFIFCKLHEAHNDIASKYYYQAKDIVTKAGNPGVLGTIPGYLVMGIGLGIISGFAVAFITHDPSNTGFMSLCGQVGRFFAGALFFGVPAGYGDYLSGNYRCPFGLEDVKQLIAALPSEEDSLE